MPAWVVGDRGCRCSRVHPVSLQRRSSVRAVSSASVAGRWAGRSSEKCRIPTVSEHRSAMHWWDESRHHRERSLSPEVMHR